MEALDVIAGFSPPIPKHTDKILDTLMHKTLGECNYQHAINKEILKGIHHVSLFHTVSLNSKPFNYHNLF